MIVVDFLKVVHQKFVANRRSSVIASHLSGLIPPHASVLDVGCGDGAIDQKVLNCRPDITISGLEKMLRPHARIHVTEFDGKHIPHADASFDVVLFIDVLHHTEDPKILLAEAKRVARKAIVLKDHFRDGLLAGTTLRFMDWAGNVPYGVPLPYNYWSREEWLAAFRSLTLEPDEIISRLGLYPRPASLVLDRGLHFAARVPIDRPPQSIN